MTRRHTPAQQYRQAHQIARDYNLLITERQGARQPRFVLHRQDARKLAYLGQAVGAEGLFNLVSKFAH